MQSSIPKASNKGMLKGGLGWVKINKYDVMSTEGPRDGNQSASMYLSSIQVRASLCAKTILMN